MRNVPGRAGESVSVTRLKLSKSSKASRNCLRRRTCPINAVSATPGYQVSTREPWNEKPPIIISKDAAPIISFPMKNPTFATVNTA
jgi:hypothetical protein